jgi:hypothetical protein
MTHPVMALDASPAKKRMTEAISSGRATRAMGVISIQIGKTSGLLKLLLDIGVST